MLECNQMDNPHKLRFEYVTDKETGEESVKLPVEDFEELMEQFGMLPEVLKGMDDMKRGDTIASEDVEKELGLSDLTTD